MWKPYFPLANTNLLIEKYPKVLRYPSSESFWETPTQRGLNFLKRPKLSYGRMIRIHPLPPPPHPSVSWTGGTHTICWWDGGRRGRAWSRIIRPQESLVLYKLFNPLCSKLSSEHKIIIPHFLETGCNKRRLAPLQAVFQRIMGLVIFVLSGKLLKKFKQR